MQRARGGMVRSRLETVKTDRTLVLVFFFFKQKTAYEITRDWSSDVCSSDLQHPEHEGGDQHDGRTPGGQGQVERVTDGGAHVATCVPQGGQPVSQPRRTGGQVGQGARSEERRVGKECRSRWSPDH